MCIICVKPKGVELPPHDTMKAMFDYNSDGSGYMFIQNEKVIIRKGYMSLESLEKSLAELDKLSPLVDMDLVLHFRITTSGGTRKEMCHPFPLVSEADAWKCKLTRQKVNVGIVHNGIINIDIPHDKDHNDTCQYITTVLEPLESLNKQWYKHQPTLNLIARDTGSKMVFMDKDGYTISGNMIYNDKDGCLYSNSTYEEARYTYVGKGYKKYDYEKWYDDYDDYTQDQLLLDYHKDTIKRSFKIVRQLLNIDDYYVMRDDGEVYIDSSQFKRLAFADGRLLYSASSDKSAQWYYLPSNYTLYSMATCNDISLDVWSIKDYKYLGDVDNVIKSVIYKER